MAYQLANRVVVRTSTFGNGTIDLGPPVDKYQSFADGGISNGSTTKYLIVDGDAWEIGIGTYASAGPTLARTTVSESSDGGSAIYLSGDAAGVGSA